MASLKELGSHRFGLASETYEQKKVRILYIAAGYRSGSTIIERILGQSEGLFAAGEVYRIWTCGFLENWLCGCGKPFRECEVWRRVCEAAGARGKCIDPVDMERLQNELCHSRWVSLRAWLSADLERAGRKAASYLDAMIELYRAIHRVTGCRVVIDSSKSSVYPYHLMRSEQADVYVVHLVRDPRAVAYSWQRKKFLVQKGGYFRRIPPTRVALSWIGTQLATSHLYSRNPGRYLLVRYEDFIRHPRRWTGRILSMVGESGQSPPFTNDAVRLAAGHGIGGNSVRFDNGTVRLIPDDEWKQNLSLGNRIWIGALTMPLLLRYGYAPVPARGSVRGDIPRDAGA